MIKINKETTSIPESLKPAFVDLFDNGRIPITSKTTHEKRISVINNGSYINADTYNNRYKLKDIKRALNDIYHNKCAFCEQRVEQVQVEHYRPKMKNLYLDSYAYYWLAFSWDNLIIACPTCNSFKSSHFEVMASRVTYLDNEENLKKINSLSSSYNDIEKPMLINPEVTDPTGCLIFTKEGRIDSQDARVKYTIETCHLDRADLNDQRRKILNDFFNDIRAESINNIRPEEMKNIYETLYRSYVRKIKDVKENFLAFRQYSIDHCWMHEFFKSFNDC